MDSITSKLSSSDKLLLSALNLIAEKGYNGVTTLEIATAAGLSEKTLFRHFGSKQKLLEAAFDRYHYAEEMKKLFAEKLVWDLQQDLLLVSRTYHEIMNRNRKMIQISLKEDGQLPGFRARTQKHPQQLLEFLTDYFTLMAEKGKMISDNPELHAFSFMMMQFGAFINDLDSRTNYSNIGLEPFVQESVKIFARALQL
ncbi:TetR/AcrR family transcriptional regulator [Paenibacillus aceris]|uniref:AcrR family transcriptional regulator n=1 Tax=Paenibacillus aceris TaxID=869555 RepID=A0ABS4I671_9BACL|nr:TetR/AcrR family transcriptional regulator [Paenibacillus aceris]MBP1966323.1 AcrR family transcriptional regulator [Paenibacillus aceris]NHW38582.1 TetR/AcrR family transcriptional regulator [Paenibacillus aceris]